MLKVWKSPSLEVLDVNLTMNNAGGIWGKCEYCGKTKNPGHAQNGKCLAGEES